MNRLENRSFYSFLTLYIISSLFFTLLVGYWYYTAQKNALENSTFHKLEHIADTLSGEIIVAHMHDQPLEEIHSEKGISVALVDTHGTIVKGALPVPIDSMEPGYFQKEPYTILISEGPRKHLNIRYVIVASDRLHQEIARLQKNILLALSLAILIISVLAWILSRLFMRPIHQKIEQIERFINDVTHELNTPISALTMTSEQVLKQNRCTEKMLRNISISTRQLYDIYRSLTYLNFRQESEPATAIDWAEVVKKSSEYYRPMCESKRIVLRCRTEETMVTIPEVKTQLLFGNLISNAIKYSPAGSTITMTLKDRCFTIEDEGIGIEEAKQKEIFRKYERGTDYSGGFGVGLSIVKSICDEYGITIEVKSTPGNGTTFELCV
jgi:two-component system OmpR family sensor kinase